MNRTKINYSERKREVKILLIIFNFQRGTISMKMDKDILVGKVSALLRVWEGIGEIGHGRKVRGWMALITELKKKKEMTDVKN